MTSANIALIILAAKMTVPQIAAMVVLAQIQGPCTNCIGCVCRI